MARPARLQPGEPSPLVEAKDVLGGALRILSEASREESGVVVDLMWHVDFDCPPDRCIQLVRLGEELIAAMRESEGGELEVIGEEDRTVFFLVRTLPPIELPPALTDVLDDFGAMREVADTTVVVRVPVRNDAKVAAASSPPTARADMRSHRRGPGHRRGRRGHRRPPRPERERGLSGPRPGLSSARRRCGG